jgi:hypothetical protein
MLIGWRLLTQTGTCLQILIWHSIIKIRDVKLRACFKTQGLEHVVRDHVLIHIVLLPLSNDRLLKKLFQILTKKKPQGYRDGQHHATVSSRIICSSTPANRNYRVYIWYVDLNLTQLQSSPGQKGFYITHADAEEESHILGTCRYGYLLPGWVPLSQQRQRWWSTTIWRVCVCVCVCVCFKRGVISFIKDGMTSAE